MVYTIIDIETTGLHKSGGDEILTFGFMRINSNFDILASGTLYFYKPDFNVSKYPACTVHKLTREVMEQHKDEFNDNIKKMFSLCYNATIIGKNSTNFDIPFVQNFVKRHCPTLESLVVKKTYDIQTEFSPTFKRMTGSTKTGTLTEYCNCLGITEGKLKSIYDSLPTKDGSSMHMHGALFDVVATYAVLKEHCRINGIRL